MRWSGRRESRRTTDSQSGYALATGKATVVKDWSNENRFRQSELQASRG